MRNIKSIYKGKFYNFAKSQLSFRLNVFLVFAFWVQEYFRLMNYMIEANF